MQMLTSLFTCYKPISVLLFYPSMAVCVCVAREFRISICCALPPQTILSSFQMQVLLAFCSARSGLALLLLSAGVMVVMRRRIRVALTIIAAAQLAERKTFCKHWFRIFYFVAGDLHIQDLIWTHQVHTQPMRVGEPLKCGWSAHHLWEVAANICRLLIKICIHLKLSVRVQVNVWHSPNSRPEWKFIRVLCVCVGATNQLWPPSKPKLPNGKIELTLRRLCLSFAFLAVCWDALELIRNEKRSEKRETVAVRWNVARSSWRYFHRAPFQLVSVNRSQTQTPPMTIG